VTLELRPAALLEPAELAALFTAAYEGYVLPMQIGEEQLRFMIDAFDIWRDASQIAALDGRDVGLANLAVRDDEAWVGGVGVVPGARRQGIGEALMNALHAQAHALGVRRVWLEVIEQNESAFRLYEKLGYAVTRNVAVWSLAHDPSATGDALEVDTGIARARLRQLRSEREPWQRADATLDHFDDLRALWSEGSAAVFRMTGGNVSLLQIAGDAAEELLLALRSEGPVHVLNLPEGDPVADALAKLGANVVVRQREMALDLT
jgi:GNAT superfamily N-acetyltransferase